MGTRVDGLGDAKIVPTASFAQLDEAADFIVPRCETLVVDGDPGVGKTTLTEHWANRQSVPVTRLALPPKQSSRDLVRMLHAPISGGNEANLLPERDLQDDLLGLLATPRVVLVRNAQRLSTEAAGQLEWLHSHDDAGWALILEGGPGTAAAVERDALLRGRIASTLTVPPLKDAELLQTLQGMHQLFLGTETDLLVEIDTRVCKGVMRHWARFLQVALFLQQKAITNGRPEPVLDRTFAKAVLNKLPSTIRPKARK